MKKFLFLLLLTATLFSCQKSPQLPVKGTDELPNYHASRWKKNAKGEYIIVGVTLGTWSYEISAATNWQKSYYCEGLLGICDLTLLGIDLISTIGPNQDTTILWESANYYYLGLTPQMMVGSSNGWLHVSKDANAKFCFPAGNYEISTDMDGPYITIPK